MSRRLRELIERWEEERDDLYCLHQSATDFLADKLRDKINELKAAIAPDWKPASEPPDDVRQEVWLLTTDGVIRGVFDDHNVDQWDGTKYVPRIIGWHEIEVPEPPEVGT